MQEGYTPPTIGQEKILSRCLSGAAMRFKLSPNAQNLLIIPFAAFGFGDKGLTAGAAPGSHAPALFNVRESKVSAPHFAALFLLKVASDSNASLDFLQRWNLRHRPNSTSNLISHFHERLRTSGAFVCERSRSQFR